jgi:hypothetical protein
MTPMEQYISVEGMDNAMEVAKVLLKNGYQVVVELDDCDIYVVGYTRPKFGSMYVELNDEEFEYIAYRRENRNCDWAPECLPWNWKDNPNPDE